MQELELLQQRIEEKLKQIQVSDKPNTLYEPIRYFLAIGGKRIRPILVLLSAKLFENKDDSVIDQALAVELFHNFTLIHDDIMDKAPLRRGVATIHEKWNDSQGILSGDVLLIIAYQYLLRTQPKYYGPLLEAFNKMAIEVCEGQQLDMDFEKRARVEIDEYINMIKLKTSVLLGCALKLGAIVSNASDEDRDHLYQFGVSIGIAFQIQDDILDVYADASKFGKQVGGDIISNKKTYLYIKARELADEHQNNILQNQTLNTNITDKIQTVKDLYDELQVRLHAEKEMEKYYEEAIKHLNAIQVQPEKKKPLLALADYLMNREV